MRVVDPNELERHVRAGHEIISLHVWDRVDAEDRKRGKSPLHNDWPRRSYSKAEVRAAIEGGHNVGIRLRVIDLVIDYDPRNDPDGSAWRALEADLGLKFLASCPTVITGGGGKHLYTKRPPGGKIREHLDAFGPSVEFKTKGRQVVAGGSKHPDGPMYRWDDFSPSEPPEIPIDLLARLIKPTSTNSTEAGTLSAEDLGRILAGLDPTEFRDHESWLRIGMAAYHGTNGLGREEFVAWSVSDEAFSGHESEIRERWDSWAASPGDSAITVNTLLHVARGKDVDISWLVRREFPDVPDVQLPAQIAKDEEAGIPDGPMAPLERLNRKFAVVPEGSNTYVYRVGPDGGPQRMQVTGFHNLLANQFFETENGKRMPLSKAWFASSRRRTYAGVEFAPSGGREGWLNTWTGWGVNPDEGAQWDMLHELIHDIVCSGEEEWTSFVLDWCATMIQRPAEPADVALCLRGPKGTGKSTLGRVLREIAGNHGFALSHGLANQFNAHLRETVFLLADEAFFAGDKKTESQLKSMITEPEIMYEPKGVDPTFGRNCLHIMMCSNEAWLAPATLDERRFAIFDINEYRDRAWWNRLHEQRLSGEMARGFLAHLLEREVLVHPREIIPQTKALADQKLQSLDPIQLGWLHVLQEGRMPAELPEEGGPQYWCDGPVEVETATLCALVMKQDRGPGARRREVTRFGIQMRSLVPGLTSRRIRRGGDRVKIYMIPSLDDCRAAFERQVGCGLDWD